MNTAEKAQYAERIYKKHRKSLDDINASKFKAIIEYYKSSYALCLPVKIENESIISRELQNIANNAVSGIAMNDIIKLSYGL